MNKSIIVYGPQGCGKNRHAERIKKHFGLTGLTVEEWGGTIDSKHGIALYLTSHMGIVKRVQELGMTALSFAEVAKQINDAIPLTDWQSGPPPMVGEWIAAIAGVDGSIRRWWDGSRWSFAFCEANSQEAKNNLAGRAAGTSSSIIKWRGLAEEPITVKI